MSGKFTGKALREFLIWMAVALLASMLIAGVVWVVVLWDPEMPSIWKPEISGIKGNAEAVVGLIALVLTLPITLAASIVVIKLGDRMDNLANDAAESDEKFSKITHDLAVQAEVRESISIAKQMYDEMFGQLKDIATALNSSMDEIYWMLHEMQAERFYFSRMSEEEQEDIKDDRRINKNVFDSKGNSLASEYIQSDEYYSGIIISKAAGIRASLAGSIGKFIQGCWSVKQTKNPHLFLDALVKYRTEVKDKLPALDELIESNPEIDEVKLKDIHAKLSSNVSEDLQIYNRLYSSISDISAIYENPLINSLLQINIASRFCLAASPEKEVVRQLMQDLQNGVVSFKEASDLLLGLILFPLPMIKLDEVNEKNSIDNDGVAWYGYGNDAEEIRANMAHEINRLGLLAIFDLRDAWPTKEDLMTHIVSMVVPESSNNGEVKNELVNRMAAFNDPRKLVATFMSDRNQRSVLAESASA